MFEFAYFRPTNIDQNVINNALIFTTLSLVRVFFFYPKPVPIDDQIFNEQFSDM